MSEPTPTLVDPRLCQSYMTCKSFGVTWRARNDTCSGCGGDISGLFKLHKIIDGHVQPLVSQVRHRPMQEIGAGWITASVGVREHLEQEGFELEPAEVGMLMVCRVLLRIAELESTVARATR